MAVFSENDVVRFCALTGDSNLIHDPAWMRQREKRPIVPGMLTFLCGAQLTKEHWTAGKSSADVYFGDFLYIDEEVTFRSVPDGLEVRLSAEADGRDVLAANGKYTQFMRERKGLPIGGHRIQDIGIERAIVEQFALLIGALPEEAAFFYAMAYMSQVLLQSAVLQEKATDKTERPIMIVPVYRSLHLEFPEGIRYIRDGTLYFCTRPPLQETEAQGKGYTRLSVSCDHDGQPIYAAQACVKMVDSRVLMRILR